MHSALRKRYVHDLITDVALLTGAAFERFAYAVIDHVAPAGWKHRGTNPSGAPVRNVVDSVADGGRLVAEYSTEEGYFAGKMAKVKKDIRHAKTNHSNVGKLWLVSNRALQPSQVTSIEGLIAKHAASGLQITVLDSRQIAEHIVDNLLDEAFVEKIGAELAMLRRIQQEWAANHRVPTYPDYIARPDVESEIKTRLASERWVKVSGLSGLGKSAVCTAVARTTRDQYELVLWLDASALQRLEELSAVDILRNGEHQNILGLMCARPCLVVLDDLRFDADLDALVAAAHPGTRVLATTQFIERNTFRLADVPASLARQILERACATPCPDAVWTAVWTAVGGHPLLLAILNGVAATEGWDAVRDSCDVAVGLEDKAHARVCDRILERHSTALRRELLFVQWCSTATIDEAFWTHVLGPAARRTLAARHFLIASDPNIVRVHDLVFSSIGATQGDEALAADFREKVTTFVERTAREDRGALLHFALLHAHLLRRLLSTGPFRPALRFALALTRPLDVSPLGNPVDDAQRLSPGGSDNEFSVMAILETIEATYGATKRRVDSKSARGWLETALPAFAALESLSGLQDDTYRNVKHHRAKALSWLQRDGEAIPIFEAILATSPTFYEARLQLARALSRQPNHVASAWSHVSEILQAARASDSVAPTVVLGAFEALGAGALKAYLVESVTLHESLLLDALTWSITRRSDQAFHFLAVVGSELSYKAPATVKKIVDILPAQPFVPKDSKERFEWAQTLKFCAKALDVADARREDLLRDADHLYTTIELPTHFQSVQQSECLLLLGDPTGALRVLDRVQADERNEFWYQRHARALRAEGRPQDALASIDKALGLVASRFRAAMLHERFLIRQALAEPTARDDLKAAIACAEGQYRTELEEELRSIETPSS